MSKEVLMEKAYKAATANGSVQLGADTIVTGMEGYVSRRNGKISREEMTSYVKDQAKKITDATKDFRFQTWIMNN